MGADSHVHIETKGRNGRWGNRDNEAKYWRRMEKENLSYEQIREIRPSYLNVLGTRNYTLFAVLGDVRNWRGGINPLPLSRRGVPNNVSKKTMKAIPFDSDYHSYTYFTVQDLLDTDWDEVATHRKMGLFADDFRRWKEIGRPPPGLKNADAEYIALRGQWHKGMEKFHREVTEDEMLLLLLSNRTKKLVKKRKSRFIDHYEKLGPYVVADLPRTYRDLVPEFIDTIPDLEALGPPDKVRVVIAYDN